MKLWTYPGSARAGKALIAGEYAGVKLSCPPFTMGTTNKTPEFLAINPFGKVRAGGVRCGCGGSEVPRNRSIPLPEFSSPAACALLPAAQPTWLVPAAPAGGSCACGRREKWQVPQPPCA